MKQQSQIILTRKSNNQVSQDLILEAPQTQRKVAWSRCFGYKARMISLLSAHLSGAFSWPTIWLGQSMQSHQPSPGMLRGNFLNLSKKAEAPKQHFQTHLLWKTYVSNVFYRTPSESLPVQMPFRTNSYHLSLYCQVHWNHSLIPGKNLKAGHCWNTMWKAVTPNILHCCWFVSFTLNKKHQHFIVKNYVKVQKYINKTF